jgi:hypothetical protein
MHCTRVLKYELLEKELSELRNRAFATSATSGTIPGTQEPTVNVGTTTLANVPELQPVLREKNSGSDAVVGNLVQKVWTDRSEDITQETIATSPVVTQTPVKTVEMVKMKDAVRCHRLQKRFGLKRGMDPMATLPTAMYR